MIWAGREVLFPSAYIHSGESNKLVANLELALNGLWSILRLEKTFPNTFIHIYVLPIQSCCCKHFILF